MFVGTYVISTVAPPTASPPDETTPEISDVNYCVNANGEMKSERRKILIDLLIMIISSKNINKNFYCSNNNRKKMKTCYKKITFI